MWSLIERGGWVMVPILSASVVSWGLVLGRAWALRARAVLTPGLSEAVLALLERGDLDAAFERCRSERSSLARLIETALRHRADPPGLRDERIELAGRRELARLERYIGVVGAIATLEPMLGLLGTVLGMIAVFEALSNGGLGDSRELSRGIGEALITTATGLVAAIPAFLGWRFLATRVDRLVLALEEEVARFLDRAGTIGRSP
jgi:biopolymer transport protein ExbB